MLKEEAAVFEGRGLKARQNLQWVALDAWQRGEEFAVFSMRKQHY